MVVIGVDPGSVRTGYGVVRREGKAFSLVTCGVIRLASGLGIPERIKIIYDRLDGLIDANRPSVLALETAYVNRNAQSALKLGQVRGAIVALTMNRGLVLHEYAPREVKQVLTGRGGAAKEQVAYMVRHFLDIRESLKPHDISDALGIALCDMLRGREGNPHGSGKSRKSSRGGAWADFVKSNPELLA
ncbi:crossover junction endodeoxyribonuclease RuvC [Prosthecochloris sp. GSB1]|uniref:crossover junction endodeoxyribonuclease RuvC n=1 Tax=Prosthecochloris sp. GSB1 TaxID=281093 RepID=UPI000B8CDE42|nr:crossover junction endodeoxyribonuclease RuvC [Prosthecochloris sp. GSB1]ASQ91067.1 crossover junction endodeoxyribonuclease RuvC [Prosthecochloris sp. GSB1]